MLMGKRITIESANFNSNPVTADINIYLGRDSYAFDPTGQNHAIYFEDIVLEDYFEFR